MHRMVLRVYVPILLSASAVVAIAGWHLSAENTPPQPTGSEQNAAAFSPPSKNSQGEKEPAALSPVIQEEPAAQEHREKNTSYDPPPAEKQGGRLLFTLASNGNIPDGIDSLFVTVNSISAYSETRGWVSFADAPKTYNLKNLQQAGKHRIMFDTAVPTGSYSQLRFIFGPAVVLKGGITHVVHMPSYVLYIPFALPVETSRTSAGVITIILPPSLHSAMNNMFVFAPVLDIHTLTAIRSVQQSNSYAELQGGYPKFSARFGMTATGSVQKDFSGIDQNAVITIIDDTLVLIPRTLDMSIFQVSEKDARRTALSGYITRVLATYASLDNKKPVWRVTGIRNRMVADVLVDAITGSVLYIE